MQFRTVRCAWILGAALILPSSGCGTEPELPPQGPHTVELHVHGMAVEAARAKVLALLENHSGVTKVKVDPDGYTAIRVSDGRATRADALVRALATAGYQAHEGEH